MGNQTSRRSFVTGLGAAGLAPVAQFEFDAQDRDGILKAIPIDPLAAEAIARRSLAVPPEDGDRTELGIAMAGLTAETVSARVADDFRAGRTVALDGWVVSITEARLCVLATAYSVKNPWGSAS